jgi:transposase
MLAQLPPCIVGMEACSVAHHWTRALAVFDHTPKLMAPEFVILYHKYAVRLHLGLLDGSSS